MIRNGISFFRLFCMLAVGYAVIEIVKVREAGLPVHWPHVTSFIP